jgi:hypothetical protein
MGIKPKQIQRGGEWENGRFRIFDFRFWIFDWGRGLSANFANFREVCGRGILTTDITDITDFADWKTGIDTLATGESKPDAWVWGGLNAKDQLLGRLC